MKHYLGLIWVVWTGFVQAHPSTICHAQSLGGRDLYLRGSFNQWAADDAQKFSWKCDHYELLVDIRGEHGFKFGDEDWSVDTDFGQGADDLHLVVKDTQVSRQFDRFAGMRLELTNGDSQAMLSVDTVDGLLLPKFLPMPVAKRVAASLQFDFRNSHDKPPFVAVKVATKIEFPLSVLSCKAGL